MQNGHQQYATYESLHDRKPTTVIIVSQYESLSVFQNDQQPVIWGEKARGIQDKQQ